MDKNTLTGILLIGLIFIGFYYWTKPSDEQLREIERQRIEMQQAEQQQQALEQAVASEINALEADTTKLAAERESRFGVFAAASVGEESFEKIETDLLIITFSNKGGRISAVELRDYKTHDGLPLILFDGEEENNYGFTLVTANNRVLNTDQLYFEILPVVKTDSSQIVTMRLNAGEKSYLDFVYNIPNDDYMLTFNIVPVEMQEVLSPMQRELEMFWRGKVRQQEKSRSFEARYTSLHFKFLADNNVESLSENKSERRLEPNRLRWVAFKNQFFSSVLIADKEMASAELESIVEENPTSPYLKEYFLKANVPFNMIDGSGTGFRFYFGHNKFQTLKSYNSSEEQLNLERLISLGWVLFRWISLILVIPMFNFFGGFIENFGIVILLMTIVIKIILFPLSYKSFISTAKMKVLKPEIDKINEKIPAEKMQERQKATMDLYRRVGVNPMGGCLPMLLQMPILIAMFWFFPAAIELRQQSFLWATDLSTYDAIISWDANIPVISRFYGNHVALFCLLMTIVNIIYTRINMATQNMGTQQMPGMKTIMYIMPVMFLFFFNNYPSGLSYYYLVSTLITIGQTYAIKATIDEDKLLKQLNENRKKPVKKSGFMARLEEAQRKQLEAQKKNMKKRK